MKNLTGKSYAKLNLFLDITGKRQDGYHEIQTVFHEIDFYDEINIKIDSKEQVVDNIIVKCADLNIKQEDNLVYKAAKSFCSYYKIKDKIDIVLKKNIPVGAGLGGGSSNCAKVLNLLASYYCKKDSYDILFSIAKGLGADVSFFLKGGTSLGEGIGEILKPINLKRKFKFLLVFPDISVSTKSVYEALGNQLTDNAKYGIFQDILLHGDICEIRNLLYNALEKTALILYPYLSKVKKDIEDLCKIKCLMTGSGSTFFLLLDDRHDADLLSLEIIKAGYRVKEARSV